MKKSLITLSFASALLYNQTLLSAIPTDGFYLGLMGGLNSASSTDFNFVNPFFPPFNFPDTGRLRHRIGGNGGGQLGYRISNFRIELEGNYAANNYNRLSNSNIVVEKNGTRVGPGFTGKTSVISGFLNGYYDFYIEDEEVGLVPYLGLGIGYAQVRNTIDFTFNNHSCPIFGVCGDASRTHTDSNGAIQGIAGLSYFVDDNWTFGLDYRYISFNKSSRFNNSRFNLNTFNLNINYYWGC